MPHLGSTNDAPPADGAPDRPPLLVLGLGANLGNRLENLKAAAAAIETEATIVDRSGVYETPPAGGPPQPDYLNAAVAVRTSLSPTELLERCLAIERRMGRSRPDPVRNGPRPIDIDLLWGEGLVLTESHLRLPHPRLAERVFALRPLLDVVPDARDPRDGRRYADLSVAGAAIRRVGVL